MTTTFKLYYTPHQLRRSQLPRGDHRRPRVRLGEVVDLAKHQTKSGKDFDAINPKGNVPAIVFADGSMLNENVATLTFLADQGNAGLAPQEGTTERYAYLNDLGFVTSELHPAYGALFNPKLSTEAREAAMANVRQRVDVRGHDRWREEAIPQRQVAERRRPLRVHRARVERLPEGHAALRSAGLCGCPPRPTRA
ncbi:MAG: hypothetical protein IPI43_28160 [Sandaracinaceae bacterium]|nr:hypothetical protein [Sandaracinaceae bacterium]